MVLLKDSITIVLLGDWNKFYMQPGWIQKEIYQSDQIEIGVNGTGLDYHVSYRYNDVVIVPSQNQVLFNALKADDKTLQLIVSCVNNFLTKANTPILFAYGLNCDYLDSNEDIFAEIVDSMGDRSPIIESGYTIENTRIQRRIKKDNRIINLDYYQELNTIKLHFNEHHEVHSSIKPNVSFEMVNEFLSECNRIVTSYGYELDGE